jgi:putative ATP-dependent endonuclease of OLD family
MTTANNAWVEPFFADYTFEVDFIQANNASVVIQTLGEIYIDPGAAEASELLLEAEDPNVAGAEALRLAKKEGKGWFAVLLAEKLTVWTYVPNYALRAIAFACHQSINDSALRRMAEFRVTKIAESNSPRRTPLIPLLNRDDLTAEQFVIAFCEAAPTDDLSDFCLYVNEYR